MASKSKDETPVKAPETPKKTPAPASAGSTLEKRVSFIERKLEKILGFDFNKDGKLGFVNPRLLTALIVLALGITAVVYAANIVNYPTASGGTGMALDTDGNLTVGGKYISNAQSVSVIAHSQTITPTSSLVLLTGTSTATNTLLANPTAVGQQLTIVNVGTNYILIADAANVEGTGVVSNDQYDAVSYIAQSASKWIQVSTSNNN